MKDIKLSFPYPSTSRHNLSQDIATSLSMGLVTPVRVIEVLPGDSHRIGTSFSLLSNPLVKPLLQSVNMRYCRFWVPSRIYNIDKRANNSNYDEHNSIVRHGVFPVLSAPIAHLSGQGSFSYVTNFEASSLFSYLQMSAFASNFVASEYGDPTYDGYIVLNPNNSIKFNAEPYLGYIDICRNYFADSASGMIAWYSNYSDSDTGYARSVVVTPLEQLDSYIDGIQNSRGAVLPYNPARSYSDKAQLFEPFVLERGFDFSSGQLSPESITSFGYQFRLAHNLLCVPLNRPDRFSRLFDLRPYTSQNATIASNEVTIGNLSYLAKFQRYLTRRFFGGSRFTDVMYSVFGQKVPHVDSPVCLDVFDYEIGSELVASTNATDTQNPGVLGGYFSAAGVLSTRGGRSKKRYTFNEKGYLIDLVYIMPRLFRTAYLPDFYPVTGIVSGQDGPMSQGNFIPDFNGIGWQQPAFVQSFLRVSHVADSATATIGTPQAFCCEPSWQQYRTLPDVCTGLFNPLLAPKSSISGSTSTLSDTTSINNPLFTFNDRMDPFTVFLFNAPSAAALATTSRRMLAQFMFTSPDDLNRVFGTSSLTLDNIFVVFRYAHQAKRQVTKRFTLSF